MYRVDVLKRTCKHLATCLPNTTFIETKNGGYFVKDNRKLGITISKKDKTNTDSFKINKWKNGYGINLDSRDVGCYEFIQKSVKKGLGIK